MGQSASPYLFKRHYDAMDQTECVSLSGVYLLRKYTDMMGQSVSPYLFRKDNRHRDAMDQSVSP